MHQKCTSVAFTISENISKRHIMNFFRVFQKISTYEVVNTTTGAFVLAVLMNTVNTTPPEGSNTAKSQKGSLSSSGLI